MWLLPIEAEEEDARQARKHILTYALLKEENRAKKHGSKVQIMEKRKSATERGMGERAELNFRTKQEMYLAFAAEENTNPGKGQNSLTER